MRLWTIAICGLAATGLMGCGQDEGSAANNAATSAAAPKPEKIPYCFFKDADTKRWAASRGKDGNVVVKGKAYRSDGRYKAVLEEAKVEGSTAIVRPTIIVNDTGFAAEGNWWDVTTVIPDSAAVDTVEVRCGKTTVAELTIPVKS